MLFCAFGLQAAFAVGPTFDGVNSIPKDGDTNVKPGDIATQFVLAFSDTPAITAAGGTLVVYKDGVILKLVPVTQSSADVSVVGKTLVVKHGIASFPEKASYELVLSTGVTVGGTPVAIAASEENFTIGDFTPPVLATTNPLAPANGTLGVKANLTYPGGPDDPFQISLTFDENIAIGTGDVAVYNANGTVMDIIRVGEAGAPVSVAGKTATINVDNNSYFAPETNYFVKVDAGAFVDVSPSANKFAGITSTTGWTFSTRVNNAPAITASISNVTAVSAKLNASINQAGKIWYKIQLASVADPADNDYTGFVDGGTVAANVSKVFDLTGLNPTGGVEYEVFVVSENTESPANKSTANGKKLTFTTTDATGPQAINRGLITTDKKTSGAYILFDEQVTGGTGNLSVRKVSDNTLLFTIPASAVSSTKLVAPDPNAGLWKVVLDFGGTIASKEAFYIVFPVGYIKDMSPIVNANGTTGNAYGDDTPGISVPVNYTDWVEAGADFEAPVVTFTTPVSLSDPVLINFNEAVELADGSSWPAAGDFASWSKYVAFQKGGVNVPATFGYAANVLTITPDDDLTSNTEYTVVLRPGVVRDLSDNANVLAAAQTKVFTTGDLDPITATFAPAGNINDYTPLTITFNKAVRAITGTTPFYEALTNTNVKATVKLEKTLNGVTTEVDPLDYSVTYDAASKVITVVPVNGKPFATASSVDDVSYTLSIRADKIEDNAGTDVENVIPATTVSNEYIVNDYKKPVATLIGNELLRTDASTIDPLTITFDEAVSMISATSPSAQVVLKLIDAQGNNVAFTTAMAGNVLTISPVPASALELGKTYYYGIGASMEDGAGNVNLPVYKSFTVVGPVVPPTVDALTYTVNGGASTPIATTLNNVVVNGDGDIIVRVTFNVNVDDKDLTTINTVTSTFAGPAASTVITNADISGKVLTITLDTPTIPASDPGTEYTITIPQYLVEANEAYSGVLKAQMSGDVVITVKTKDTEKPVVTAVWDGTTGVATDATLELNFSEPVNPVAGKTIKFNYGAGPTTAETVSITSANVVMVGTDGKKWEVKHAAFNQYNTVYSVVIAKDAFVDAASNNLGASDVTFTFTTVTNPPPTITAYTPNDEADLVGTSLDLNIVFSEPVEQASITGSRKLVYVIEKVGTADATINGAGDLVIAGDDVQKYYAYVDDLTKVVVSGNTVTIKGVTLDASKEYYVLITPGAFKDKSLPTTASYAGITSYGATAGDPWNFFTKDIYAPEVTLSFNRLGLDGLTAANSDIILTFSKLIVKNSDGTAITNSSIPGLIKLEKWTGATWQNLAYTGHITGENTIVIDNSSLVLLGEMKTDTKYRVSFIGTPFKGKVSGTAVGAFSEEFWTTDATAPSAPEVTFKNDDEVNDVSYNTTDGDVINLNIAAADVNSGLTDHTAIKVHYLKSPTDLNPTGAEVKGLAQATKDLTGNDNFDVTYKGGMASKTTYYVYAVAEDVAGNLSAVTKFPVITDDRVKPVLAAALPTTFSNDGKITLKFDEPVKPITGAKARVIDNATGITYLADLANLTGGDPASLNEISIVAGSFLQMSLDVASYTVEIDPGMIVDVPREVGEGDMVNAPNAWDGIVGTSFVVSSKDQVKPTLVSAGPSGLVDINQAFTLAFSEAVNLNSAFTQIVVLKGTDPYDIINTADISGQGTSSIVLTPKRALVSGDSYTIVVPDLIFSDLSGNVMNSALLATRTISYTAKDVVPLSATFKADATTLPSSSALSVVPTTLTVDFGEAFFLTSNLDPNVNTYELQSHFYLIQDGAPVSFVAEKVGNTVVLSDLSGSLGLGDAAKGKTYTFGFVNLYDASGNLKAGKEASFSVKADAVVDRLVTFIPGDNDGDSDTKVNITVDQTFTIEFKGIIYSYNATESLNNLIMTKELLTSLGTIYLTPMPSGATLDITNYSEVGGKSVVTLKVSKPLDSEVNYTLHLNDNSTIQVGQGFAPLGAYHEHFITADVKAPKLIADGSGVTLTSAYLPVKVGVAGKDQMLALVFDEEVKGAGIVRIHRWDGVEVASVDITGVTSSEDEGEWTLNIAKPADLMAANPGLVTNQDYYIEVPAGAIIDMAITPNPFAGVTAVNEWKISLRDDTTPQVTFVDDTKSGLPINTQIKLTFDRPVEMGKGWLALYYEDGKAVDLIRTSAGSTAMSSYNFTLSRDLAPNTKFFVELGEGTFDLAVDNSIKQEQKSIGGWYFSTEVNAAPVATEFVPAKTTPRTEGVELTSGLSITFDMDVLPGTGNIQLHRKQNAGGPIITNFDVTDASKVSFVGNKLTIDGSVLNLQNNSEYYVIVPATAVKNTSTTPEFWAGITVPFVWEFTTLNDTEAPTAVVAPNGPEAIGLVPAEVELTMTFNEAVVAGLGNLVIYDAVADTIVETIAVEESMLVDKVLTIAPTKLAEGMSYYVKVDAGVVKDLANNNYAGIDDKATWTFATGDFTAPELASWTPNKITTADTHPTFVMTFVEDVKVGTGNLMVVAKDGGNTVLTIPITAAMVNGNTVTVTYVATAANSLARSTDYYVLVDAGAVKDISDNAFAGVSDVTAWTFKTGENFPTVDVELNDASQFKVYPNPFVEFVNVDNASKLSRVVVTNIAGQIVKEVVNPTNRIQLNELRSGIYFMSLYNADNVIAKTAKIVKR
jgi:methionine-rich copper-binding protein CopC